MNNMNLPKVKKENIFVKIKSWFENLFKSKKMIKLNEINETTEQSNRLEHNDFKERVKLENQDEILNLQRKLKDNQMNISDLSNEELEEMIALYKKQIEEKKIKLRQYRKLIIQSNN